MICPSYDVDSPLPQRAGSSLAWNELQTSSTDSTPSQCRGNACACAASVLRENSSRAYEAACGTMPSTDASAHVSQPFTANHVPPTYTAPLPPIVRGGSECSVTSGSLAAGVCEDPIRAGPWTSGEAPTPVRKRLTFATTRRACGRDHARASNPHGCGSPNTAPDPICRAPA